MCLPIPKPASSPTKTRRAEHASGSSEHAEVHSAVGGVPARENACLMCGIVGYVGTKNCVPILVDGLRALEYRGYDSAGLAVHGHASASQKGSTTGSIEVVRAVGKLAHLEA